MSETKGIVFNIVHGSFVDGHGIRTTVFLKGCPLKCKWCCNPEGQKAEPELKYSESLCNGCKNCLSVCPVGAIKKTTGSCGETVTIDTQQCTNCLKCIDVCYTGAMDVFGESYTVDELFEIVRRDLRYYKSSGGGVTIGGGEASMQSGFTLAFLRKCKDNFIHTAVDTCGFTLSDEALSVLSEADLLLFDMKGSDPAEHLLNTGVSNEPIIRNMKALDALHVPMIVRMPLIPGYTDSDKNIRKTAEFLSTLRSLERVDLLNYHEFGKTKYVQLGREYPLSLRSLTEERVEQIAAILTEYSIIAHIGG